MEVSRAQMLVKREGGLRKLINTIFPGFWLHRCIGEGGKHPPFGARRERR